MPVIKNANSTTMVRDAVVLDLGDLRRQAEGVLERARAEGEAMLAQARAEAAAIAPRAREEARKQGLEQGLREGREQGAAKGRAEAFEESRAAIDNVIAGWTEALERWERDRGAMFLEAREDVLALALAIAERVCHRVVEVDPACVVDQIAAALSIAAVRSTARVRMNPGDRAVVDQAWPALVQRLSQCAHAKVEDDPSIERGGCRVITDHGSIDASISLQIDRIVDTLLGEGSRLRGPGSIGETKQEAPPPPSA